ncbi:MAG: hypothetical protein J0H98_08965 [Solirubrobacterales bacterium]|nr:hypothetical protein [Solirubrobacterales bacterium]
MISTVVSESKLPGRWGAAGATVFAVLFAALAFTVRADAQVMRTEALPGGVQRSTYRIGPLTVTPGQNRIFLRPIAGAGTRPDVNGWITRIKPDLVNEDGSIPPSSHVMFHHGVWINNANGELFYATGEEKTIMELPPGYGYKYNKNDSWTLNDMIHNLTPQAMKLYVEYTVDFIPDSAPEADSITRARPIWMDVQQGIYPVFDVHRDSGGADGKFTYPQDDPNAYPAGVHLNEKKINKDGVLLGTTGHVHTGGLATDLYLRRDGASYGGETCPPAESFDTQLNKLRRIDKGHATRRAGIQKRIKKLNRTKAKVRKTMRKRKVKQPARRKLRKLTRMVKTNRRAVKRVNRLKAANMTKLRQVEAQDKAAKDKYQACVDSQPQVEGNRVHLFESKADYFDPRGPISWDMAMYSTDQDWRVAVKAGDTLELQATYETKIASWYESMGINIVYWAPNETGGKDPYVNKVDTEGVLNHGHLAENEDYGGETGENGSKLAGPDPTKLADGLSPTDPITIGGYTYSAGGFRLPGANGRPAVVPQGQSLTFQMGAGEMSSKTWHSLTSCKSPCNKSTGISYPIADGKFQFDSGQLGTGGPPTVERTTWSTPNDLPKGTYTFFCRIHPLMRGAFRVK